MGDEYKQVCVVFFTHEPSSYKYFHVLISSHANPSFGVLNYQVHHWCNEIPCQDAFHVRRHTMSGQNAISTLWP